MEICGGCLSEVIQPLSSFYRQESRSLESKGTKRSEGWLEFINGFFLKHGVKHWFTLVLEIISEVLSLLSSLPCWAPSPNMTSFLSNPLQLTLPSPLRDDLPHSISFQSLRYQAGPSQLPSSTPVGVTLCIPTLIPTLVLPH